VLAGDQVAGGAEALDRAAVRKWGEHGDWAAPVCDLDRLAGLDTPQELARPLPEFTYSYCRHVLVVAHGDSLVEGAVGASRRWRRSHSARGRSPAARCGADAKYGLMSPG
jgi:hypothetical protein